jgi:hypothetical protein
LIFVIFVNFVIFVFPTVTFTRMLTA